MQIATAAELFTQQEGIMNVYSDAAPGLEFVERARSELTADEVENAASRGRKLSVKEALVLAKVAGPPDA